MFGSDGGRSLEVPFYNEDVLQELISSDGNKAPGPDGFNFKFAQTFCQTLEGSFFLFLTDFSRWPISTSGFHVHSYL